MLKRIVVKIGSSSLTGSRGGLNREAVAYFAGELARLYERGYQPLLVTSGAVAAGFRAIGYSERPKKLHEKQASAAVGQALLMRAYQEELAKYGHVAAQILLTRTDFHSRKRIGSAVMTIEELLERGILPIFNENDTVSVDELKFGDNDTLSALVANLVKADRLVILTDTDGLYSADPRHDPDAFKYETVDEIDDDIYRMAGGAGTGVGTGGMRSKLDAARIATRGGVPVFVGRADESGDLAAAAEGAGKGTHFTTKLSSMPVKKQWLGYLSRPLGALIVDAGARRALAEEGRSLLPVGITGVEGQFHAGDVVEVRGPAGEIVGRGVVNYDMEDLQSVCGLPGPQVLEKLNGLHRLEAIHRDEWISLG
ncbi:glutamate 5-kinase [Saccharibacillus alkalitolerans]|uniref:Glutamate 5-kinase n=1 Tax=Saccharibacillus alkalitolerans TaxID=2705290 RepID=A0ABX0F347_9BACL|nr:glutamate 5-kinase [Saccharibacillus alkalitolerans]NGZ74295.1 glutamate 5-kinase [Saccharibacillus alkalitolerans]